MRKNGYTKAIAQFQRSLTRAEKLRRLDIRQFADPPAPADQDAVEALRSGAVVLMVASLEQYLKDALQECVEIIAIKARVTTHQALEARFVQHNDSNFFHYLANERRFDKATKLAEIKRVSKLVAADHFVVESFNRTRSNPGPKTVKDLLNDYGIQDPFGVIEGHLPLHYKKPFPQGFAAASLEALITRRNEVAHGAYGLTISRVDLEEAIAFLKGFVKALDNTLRDRTRLVLSQL